MTCFCHICRNAPTPTHVGDAHGVVLTLSLDLQEATWLAYDVLDRPSIRDDEAAKEIIRSVNRIVDLEALDIAIKIGGTP